MSLSDYAENKVLEHVVGKTSFTMPSSPYMALFSANPTDTVANELTGNGYARIAVAGSAWGTAASGSIANTSQIQFAAASGSSWTVHGWALFDASSTGNELVWGLMTDSTGGEVTLTVNVGDQVTFAAAGSPLQISID
jgi:hypothetical protein